MGMPGGDYITAPPIGIILANCGLVAESLPLYDTLHQKPIVFLVHVHGATSNAHKLSVTPDYRSLQVTLFFLLIEGDGG